MQYKAPHTIEEDADSITDSTPCSCNTLTRESGVEDHNPSEHQNTNITNTQNNKSTKLCKIHVRAQDTSPSTVTQTEQSNKPNPTEAHQNLTSSQKERKRLRQQRYRQTQRARKQQNSEVDMSTDPKPKPSQDNNIPWPRLMELNHWFEEAHNLRGTIDWTAHLKALLRPESFEDYEALREMHGTKRVNQVNSKRMLHSIPPMGNMDDSIMYRASEGPRRRSM